MKASIVTLLVATALSAGMAHAQTAPTAKDKDDDKKAAVLQNGSNGAAANDQAGALFPAIPALAGITTGAAAAGAVVVVGAVAVLKNSGTTNTTAK